MRTMPLSSTRIEASAAYPAQTLLLKSLEKRYQSGKAVVRGVNFCLKTMGAA